MASNDTPGQNAPFRPVPSLTGSISRYELPYPLSALYRKYRCATSEPMRFAYGLLLAEGVFRFFACTNLANAIAEGAPPKKVAAWLKMIVNPSMGKLLGLNRATLGFIESSGKQPFVSEVSALMTGDSWDAIQTQIPEMRNDYAHRHMALSKEAAQEKLSVLEPVLMELLQGIQFLRHYRFGVFTDVSRRPKNGWYTARWRQSRGAEEEAEPVRLRVCTPPLEGEPMLLNRDCEQGLMLSPLFRRTDRAHVPQHMWLDGLIRDGKEVSKLNYRHPVLVESAYACALVDDAGDPCPWRDYLASPADWHQIVSLSPEPEDRKRLTEGGYPSAFEDRYEFVGLVGSGGMGNVYEVLDNLGQTRALKVLKRDFVLDAKRKRRLEEEARMLASLDHPSLLEVYRIDKTPEGMPYIEMELFAGETLAERLAAQERLPLNEALAILDALLDVLAHVHDKGIWHRDIKPSNIMIGQKGIRLIDFGIAKNLKGAELTASQTSSLMGSQLWMAPEQWLGEASNRSDIYACGMVLSAILGSPPKVPTQAPVFPPESPAWLKSVYAKACESSPLDRFDSVAAMRKALAEGDAFPVKAHRPAVSKPSAQNGRLLGVWAAGLGLLFLGVFLGFQFLGSGSEEPEKAESPPLPPFDTVRISPGWFTMGSLETESPRGADELAHDSAITRPFEMMKTEVTQSFFQSLMGHNPSTHEGCAACPVENIDWKTAVKLANALSVHEGLPECYTLDAGTVSWTEGLACTGWRLPTESEWEYAARGGDFAVYPGSSDADSVAWHVGNSGGQTQAVCGKSKNGFGLCDMSGNVYEWVWDLYGDYPDVPVTDNAGPPAAKAKQLSASQVNPELVETARVRRGGSWRDPLKQLRVSSRNYGRPTRAVGVLGVRLVKTVGAQDDGVLKSIKALESRYLNAPVAVNTARAKRLVVLEFTSGVSEPELLQVMAEMVRNEALNLLGDSDFKVMDPTTVFSILADQGMDASTIVGASEIELGRNIGADFVVTGQMIVFDGPYWILNLRLYETESGSMLKGHNIEAKSSKGLRQALPRATLDLLQPLKFRPFPPK